MLDNNWKIHIQYNRCIAMDRAMLERRAGNRKLNYQSSAIEECRARKGELNGSQNGHELREGHATSYRSCHVVKLATETSGIQSK